MKLTLNIIQFSRKSIFLSVLVIFIAGRLQAQDSANFGLFASDDILAITIKTDLKKLINQKREEKYQKAELILNNKPYSIRVKARGNYRLENCSFPPIMLNFSKTEFDDNSNNSLKKLKLVNVCKMQNSYTQYLFREYLIYRAFNLMTGMSFKVRLLEIEYVDTNKKMKSVTQYGFVIEDQDIMADRLDGIIIKITGLKDQVTNTEQIVMLSIFQFMIGNTDWQVASRQNLKLLKINDFNEPAPYAIPYDFDYTGMVNASYAIPADMLGIENIRKRLYWGKCFPQEDLKVALEKFYDKKDDIYQLYQNFTFFDKASRNYSISYLNSFYKIIENEKQWNYYFIDKCRD